MKKYFLEETGKEIKLGDNFKAHIKLEGEFCEAMANALEALGVLKVEDFAEDGDDDDEDYDLVEELSNLCERYEDMELRMEKMEESVAALCTMFSPKKGKCKLNK